MNDMTKEFQPRIIDPAGGRGMDEPSALETLERTTDIGVFEVQAANSVVGKYLNEPGARNQLEKFMNGHSKLPGVRKVKLVIEGTEHQVSLGEIRRHLGELEGESGWRDELESVERSMLTKFEAGIDGLDKQCLKQLVKEIKAKPWKLGFAESLMVDDFLKVVNERIGD